MNVDVSFKTSKVYNLQDRFDIAKGETFSLLVTDENAQVDWFTNNDPVLSLVTTGPLAKGTADTLGTSLIKIFSADDQTVLKTITVNVLASIEEPAANLNTSTGTPIPK